MDGNPGEGILILMGLLALFFTFLTAFGITWHLKRRKFAAAFGGCFFIVAAVLIYLSVYG